MKTKKIRPTDIDYRIVWNADRRSFDIWRKGIATAMFSPSLSTPIGLARSEALRDLKKDGLLSITITSEKNGKSHSEMQIR